MGAVERARRDVEQGRHWLARQRLGSYLVTNGYDPDILAMIGRISYEMHDEYDAGRMWLLSSAKGSEVERAIDTFLARAGKDPNQIVSQLPRSVRLRVLEQYPESIRSRIRRCGLAEAILWDPKQKAGEGDLPWYGTAIILIVLIFCLIVFFVGVGTVTDWIFG